jgi:hypothetical protein
MLFHRDELDARIEALRLFLMFAAVLFYDKLNQNESNRHMYFTLFRKAGRNIIP